MADTFPAASGLTGIDTRMGGRAMVTSAYLLDAAEPAIVETGPTTSLASVAEGLAQLGVGPDDLAHIVVTHVHLDHAGGAGALAARFPAATVWAHERGAPHLADPTRLVASAARVFGEERMRELFGPVEPVPRERVMALADGDRIGLGHRHLDVLHTPGHASHHVALADSETGAVFAGDALGVHLPDVRVLRPATPPPEIDVELAVESIGRILERARSLLMFSHFGPIRSRDEIEELCELAARRLRRWADVVREGLLTTEDADRLGALLRARTAVELEEAPPGADLDRYELLSTMEMNAAGLARYWRKRAEREAADDA